MVAAPINNRQLSYLEFLESGEIADGNTEKMITASGNTKTQKSVDFPFQAKVHAFVSAYDVFNEFLKFIVLNHSNYYTNSFPFSLASIALSNQSLPSTMREISSEEQVSPVALTIVAAGSTRKPIVAIIGKASGGKP